MAAKNQTEDVEGPFDNRQAAYEAHWLCADIQKVLGTHIMETEGLTLQADDEAVQFYKFFKQVKDDLIEGGAVDSSKSPLTYREQFETPDSDMWSDDVTMLINQKLDKYGDDETRDNFNITGFTEIPEDVAAEKLDIHYEDTQQSAIFLPMVDGKVFDPAGIMPDDVEDDTKEDEADSTDIDDGLAELEAELGADEEDDEDEITPDMDPDLGDDEGIIRIDPDEDPSSKMLEIAETEGYNGFEPVEIEKHDTDEGRVGFVHVKWDKSEPETPDTEETEETEAEVDATDDEVSEGTPTEVEEPEPDPETIDEPDTQAIESLPADSLERYIDPDNEYQLRDFPDEDVMADMEKQDVAILLKLDDPSRSFRKIEKLMEDKFDMSYSSTSVGNALKRHYGDQYEAFKDWAKNAGKEEAKKQEEAGEQAAEEETESDTDEVEEDDLEDELDDLVDDEPDASEEMSETIEEKAEEVEPEPETIQAAEADETDGQTGPLSTLMADANVKQDAIDLNRVLIGASCRLAKEDDEEALTRLYRAVMNVDEFEE